MNGPRAWNGCHAHACRGHVETAGRSEHARGKRGHGTDVNWPRLWLLVLLLMQGVAARAVERVGDVEVTMQPLATADGYRGVVHGYVECRVRLRNLSAKDQTVRLSHPFNSELGSGISVSRTVVLTAKQEATVSLFLVAPDNYADRIRVSVDGVRESGGLPAPSVFDHSYDGITVPAVLIGRSVPQEFRDRARGPAGPEEILFETHEELGVGLPYAKEGGSETEPAGVEAPLGRAGAPPRATVSGSSSRYGSPTSERSLALLRSELPVSQWSPNWLGYSCFDAILVTEEEAAAMPSQVQLAVRRYLECGGTLVVHGYKVPAAFTEGAAAVQGGFHVGLGYATASLGPGESGWDATYEKLSRTPLNSYRPVSCPSDPSGALVKGAAVPVRGLFALVLLFALGIGPVNLWLLSKYKRRIWLWWNVPVISLVTCLTVFFYAMFSEGWRGRGKVASVTVLDQRNHRATTFGYLSYYCPLTPSGGLRFGADTEVIRLEQFNNHAYEYGGYRSRRRYEEGTFGARFVDWTNEQHFTAGWVTARTPAYFQFRKNEDRRERLTIEKRPDGSLRVVNALGADIRRLRVADAAGRAFEGRDIAAGAEAILAPNTGQASASAEGIAVLRNTFAAGEWLGAMQTWARTGGPPGGLPPGTYAAVLDRSPFVETPLNVSTSESAAVVFGIYGEADDGR